MKGKITVIILAGLSIVSCKIFKTSADKFISYEHKLNNKNLLISNVHKQSWKIAYRYGAECKPNERDAGERLEEGITAALNVWLQPLRDLKPTNSITSIFLFQQHKDLKGDMFNEHDEILGIDLRVTFRCEVGFSFAILSFTPDLVILGGAKLAPHVVSHLTHEVGHLYLCPPRCYT